MQIDLTAEVKGVAATGDIHGNLKTLAYEMDRRGISDYAIVVCGDVGLGFAEPAFYDNLFVEIERKLLKHNNYLILLRGNHDDPDYFNRNKCPLASSLRPSQHIMIVEDYTLLTVGSVKGIMVGGAISVDRSNRRIADNMRLFHELSYNPDAKIRRSYWEDERPIYDPIKLGDAVESAGYGINVVFSHTSPSDCELISRDGIRGWMDRDDQLEADLTMERKVFDDIRAHLIGEGCPLKRWYYGHFHKHMSYGLNGIEYTMLNMCPRDGAADIVDLPSF